MKKHLLFTLLIAFVLGNAQASMIKSRVSGPLKLNYQTFTSRKETLIQKEIFKLGEFKGITIQKMVLKNLSDNSSLAVLGLMTYSETFDQISKRTTV